MNPIKILHDSGRFSIVVPIHTEIFKSREIFIHEYCELEAGKQVFTDHLIASAYSPYKDGYCCIGESHKYFGVTEVVEAVERFKLIIMQCGLEFFLQKTEPLNND